MVWYKMNGTEMEFWLADRIARPVPDRYRAGMFKYNREIVINNGKQYIQYSFIFTNAANNQLIALLENMIQQEIPFQEIKFKMTKTGEGIDTRYYIQQIGNSKPINVVKPNEKEILPASAPAFQLLHPVSLTYILSPRERETLNQAKQYPEKLSKEDFTSGFKYTFFQLYGLQSALDAEKMNQIYQMYLNEK